MKKMVALDRYGNKTSIRIGRTIDDCINKDTKPVFVERLKELPDYKFNVLDDLELPFKIIKNDEGKWCIMYCRDVLIKDDTIYCGKACFDDLKNSKNEFNKFKEWLDDQPVNVVYVKDIGGE